MENVLYQITALVWLATLDQIVKKVIKKTLYRTLPHILKKNGFKT